MEPAGALSQILLGQLRAGSNHSASGRSVPNEQAQPRFGRKAKNVGWSALLGLDYTTPLKRSLVSSESGRGER